MPDQAYETREGITGAATARERTTVQYAPADVLALLWRRLPLMIAVFVVIAVVGVIVALQMKETFPASSSLLIRLGQEYVYQPAVGDAARGATPSNDQVVQSELEILQSEAVRARTVDDIGLARLSPDLGRAYARASTEDKRRDIRAAAIESIRKGLKIATAPDNSIVKLTYAARDPELAALVLNTLVDEYLRYRRTVLIDGDASSVQAQLNVFQTRLDGADAAYQKFLVDNGIGSGDFDAEKTSLTQLYAQLTTEAYSVQAGLSEAQGRLGVTARNVAAVQPEVNLYRDLDHTAQDALNKLRTDRQDLLARYLPTAQPVREIDQKIAAQQALVSRGPLDGGAKRVGPNPIYQSLVTDRNSNEAQVASFRDRLAAVRASMAEIAGRRQKLAGLEAQNQALSRQRDILTNNVKSLAQRVQESQAAQALAKSGDDNIKVVERAYPATQGTSLKKPVMILAILFAAFAALCAGLLSAFLSKGYPTPQTIERTLHMPVLATAPLQRA